ncbi:MAG: TonB-dependent receptor, partial [Holophagaceae bacterium]
TWDLRPNMNVYAGMNQGNRAPSPIELSCADRNSPCVLSNAFGSDPFLKQVVARTLEGGLRGKTKDFEWQFGAYRTELTDDILFVSSSTSAGYFSNVGRTRRQGLEALLARKADSGLAWSARYNLIDATFQSPAVLFSTNNSSADPVNGEIQVLPGNRIPGIPQQQLQLAAHWLAASWRIGGILRATSWSYVRGNENNQHQAGATAAGRFSGSGRSPGYAVMDLTGSMKLDHGVELLGKIGNLFDRRYVTGGILGENAFAGGSFVPDSSRWVKETFYSPGAPRSLWAGLSFKFD